jgi:hypothetical protein
MQKAVGVLTKHVYYCLTKLQAQSFVLFIRSPSAALLHAEMTGKYEGDVVAGAANARKKYNTVCLWIQSVQPVCGYNCNSVRLWTQFVRCLWIQLVHRL